MPEVTPGVKTSEFWTAIIGGLGAALPAVLLAMADKPWAAAIIGVAAIALPAIYIAGRALLKAEAAKQIDVIPDSAEDILKTVLDALEAIKGALPAAVDDKQLPGAPT